MIRPLPINANPAAVCGRSITEPDITSEIPTIAMAAPARTNANTPWTGKGNEVSLGKDFS